jgi:hypothetical protein
MKQSSTIRASAQDPTPNRNQDPATIRIVPPLRDTLQSWKEIASELNRGVRTVQRWERTLGLPVRRLGNGPRCPVFAFKDELTQWLQAQNNVLEFDRGQKYRGPRSEPGRPKADRGLLHSVNDFFTAVGSTHQNQNCDQCGCPMHFLNANFWVHGTSLRWSMYTPFCPVCDDRLELFRRSRIQ